jgi:hypothetical protein
VSQHGRSMDRRRSWLFLEQIPGTETSLDCKQQFTMCGPSCFTVEGNSPPQLPPVEKR